jgi:hypothetical protein
MAVNVKSTARQRRNFVRLLNRHGLRWFLVFDTFTGDRNSLLVRLRRRC